MKKRLMMVVAGMLAAVMLTGSLAACNTAGDPVDYAGVYELSRAEVMGIVVDGSDLSSILPPTENYIEIVDSKNMIVVLEDTPIKCTYTLEGTTLKVNDGNDVLEFTFIGNEISFYFAEENMTMIFVRR